MQLLVQPDDGVFPLLKAIRGARRTIDIHVFRLDYKAVEKALEAAVGRGVVVRTLIAHTNRGGDKTLRKLEQRLLHLGATVSRTADDLVRYHGKMAIFDEKVLHVYGFNFTRLDVDKSRSFGIITKNKRLVSEAQKLFMADFDRLSYTPGCDRFVVSPENARERLAKFLRAARKQLLIYDPKVSDDAMLKILTQRMKAGVDVRVIGKVQSKWNLTCDVYPGKRLHVRAIIRDGRRLFVGSQSLRRLELEKRREVGVIVTDQSVVREINEIFEADWAQTSCGRKQLKKIRKAAKKEEKELAAAS